MMTEAKRARCIKIMQEVADGWTLTQATERAGITYFSAKNHLYQFYLELEVSSIAQAIAVCFRKGWVK